MEYTGERYIPDLDASEISYEHWHRYLYASQFVIDKVVLDIACGEGYGSYLLSQKAKKAVGVDISQEVISFASSKYVKGNLEFKAGSASNIPVEGTSVFDAIVSFETIEHITEEEQGAFLGEVKRLLKPDGIFIVSTPNKLLYSDIPKYRNEFHLKEFYVHEFKEFLGKYFKKVKLLGQKIYPVSYIWDQDDKEKKLVEYRLNFSEKGFRPTDDHKDMLYMVAICSDKSFENINDSIVVDLSEKILKLRDKHIANLESAVKEKAANILSLQDALKERDQRIANKEQAAQALQTQVADQEQTPQTLQAQLTVTQEQLAQQAAEKERAVETLNMQVAQRDGRIRALESEVSWQDGRIKTLEAELAFMRNSRSWRITTPLRAIMHVLQRYRNTLPVHTLKLFYWLMTGQLGQRLRLRRQARLIAKSGLFDTAFYLEQNPDVAQAGVDPILHYLTFGAKEGRDPSQLFDTSYYLEQNPDVAKEGMNPLVHYLRHGAAEGRRTQDSVGTSGPGRKKQPSALQSTYKRFTLYASSLGNYFFWEIRDLLASGLEELGFAVDIRNEEDGFAEATDWHLVIAPHEFFYLGAGEKLRHTKWPGPMILFNTEQPSTQWFSLAYDCFPKAYCIWDINYEASQLICTRGFVCKHLPLGYVPGFKLFQEVKELSEHNGTHFLGSEIREHSYLHESLARRPIDILFVGHLSPRREEFFAKAAPVLSSYLCYLYLSDSSTPILPGKNTYMSTATVMGLAQRSKIVLNIHQGQDKYFEWHRIVTQGIWQQALVISEPCGLALPFRPGLDFIEAPLEEIPEKIKYYLSSPEGQKEAQAVATQGFETLTEKCRLADFLRPLILQLYVPKSQNQFWQSPILLASPADVSWEQSSNKVARDHPNIALTLSKTMSSDSNQMWNFRENNLPLPPDDLALRVGSTAGGAFEEQGHELKEFIIRSLPEDYDFTNKRVLDFGCGSGRVLRHFHAEAQKGEFWACDIHYPSILWLSENLPTHFRAFHISEFPPHLPIESNHFDLIYALSVFTHLTTSWKPWLLELRRVLKPGGILLITFHSRAAYEYSTGQHFDEKNIGMLILHENRDWDQGGPMVYHSNWWVQKQWGPFYNVDYISREAFFNWQSLAVLIKPEKGMKKEQNHICPILQPYLYQFYNPFFLGDLHIWSGRLKYLRYWHGLEVTRSESGEGIISGWFASKSGRITTITFVVNGKEIMELHGTNRERKDVAIAYPDWSYSLHSGFEVTLKLSDYEIGEHDLKVIAIDSTGQQHELQVPLILLEQ